MVDFVMACPHKSDSKRLGWPANGRHPRPPLPNSAGVIELPDELIPRRLSHGAFPLGLLVMELFRHSPIMARNRDCMNR
jgi:hypothetical protein